MHGRLPLRSVGFEAAKVWFSWNRTDGEHFENYPRPVGCVERISWRPV